VRAGLMAGHADRRGQLLAPSGPSRSIWNQGSRHLVCLVGQRPGGPRQDPGEVHRRYPHAARDGRPGHVHDVVGARSEESSHVELGVGVKTAACVE